MRHREHHLSAACRHPGAIVSGGPAQTSACRRFSDRKIMRQPQFNRASTPRNQFDLHFRSAIWRYGYEHGESGSRISSVQSLRRWRSRECRTPATSDGASTHARASPYRTHPPRPCPCQVRTSVRNQWRPYTGTGTGTMREEWGQQAQRGMVRNHYGTERAQRTPRHGGRKWCRARGGGRNSSRDSKANLRRGAPEPRHRDRCEEFPVRKRT